MNTRLRALLLVVLGLVACGAMIWLCRRDPRISFLPREPGAEWIVFPNAVDVRAHTSAKLDATFRHEITLNAAPAAAALVIRAAKEARVTINDAGVELPAQSNWKDASRADVATVLHSGINVIEVHVFNADGPPALWFALRADDVTVSSDETWQAEFAGSAWRNAALASTARIPGAGNPIAGGETTIESLRRVWPVWVIFAAIAGMIVAAAHRFLRDGLPPTRWQTVTVLIILSGLWAALFWNNTRLVPVHAGFDSQSHIDYVAFVQQRHALPLPSDGVQMFQPPLFYIVGAAVLSACRVAATEPAAAAILRALTMLFGVAHFVVVFATLRLLWPAHLARQLIGLTVAAFLPMNLYVSQFCTNETLVALLVSASVYQCLCIVRSEQTSWPRVALLGLTLGAAIATKFTAILVLPWLIAALVMQFASRKSSARDWVPKLGALMTIAAVIGGSHYVRIYDRVGALIIGGWDPATGLAWWQEDGYRVGEYFVRFGRSVVHPFFSAGGSFADGIYSTLWGDGLCAGVPTLISRVPWNYELMSAGYLLALIPTLLIATGAAVSLLQFAKRGGAELVVLLGLAFATVCGLVYLNVRVPAYASVKAFYGLSALTPLVFFAVSGWDAVPQRVKALRFVIAIGLLVWAMNSFASVWIRDSAALHLYVAARESARGADASIAQLTKAVELDPTNAVARRLLSSAFETTGRTDEAIEQAKRAVELAPTDGASHFQLASVLTRTSETAAALTELRRAIEVGPENPLPYNLLSFGSFQSGAISHAIDSARAGLAISPFNPELRFSLAAAEAQSDEFAAAAKQLAYVIMLRPAAAEARTSLHLALLSTLNRPEKLRDLKLTAPESSALQSELAWLLATIPDDSIRDGAAAVRIARHACELEPTNSPQSLRALAAAYGETGQFDDAIRAAEKARGVATIQGDSATAGSADELIAAFRAHQPFREQPHP